MEYKWIKAGIDIAKLVTADKFKDTPSLDIPIPPQGQWYQRVLSKEWVRPNGFAYSVDGEWRYGVEWGYGFPVYPLAESFGPDKVYKPVSGIPQNDPINKGLVFRKWAPSV